LWRCSADVPAGRAEAVLVVLYGLEPEEISLAVDWLQRVGLVENDKYCERLVAVWGRAPLGVRVRLREWP
jgi:hypothetical protein